MMSEDDVWYSNESSTVVDDEREHSDITSRLHAIHTRFTPSRSKLKALSIGAVCVLSMLFLANGLTPAPSRSAPLHSIDYIDQPSVQHPETLLPKKPSVSGALSDLHHAVSNKLHSWNPYKNQNHNSPSLTGEHIHDGTPEPDRLGAKTRIGKCTILYNGNSYWERALRTHERHDKLHNYRLHILRQPLIDDVWSKPAYILSLLLRELAKPEGERLDWLFWVDADTVILNPHIPIQIFLPPGGEFLDDVHLLYSKDWNGLNNGVMPIRVSEWSVELFSAVLSFRYYRPDDGLRFRDQSAMDALIGEGRFRRYSAEVPQRWFNAYLGEANATMAPYQVRRGDLLVHFAGLIDREKRMGKWLERAEGELEDWEIPLRATSYPMETREFWEEHREKMRGEAGELEDMRAQTADQLAKNEDLLKLYGEKIKTEEKKEIEDLQVALADLLRDEKKWHDDPGRLWIPRKKLEDVCAPLEAFAAEARKGLMDAAHDAIFAGLKELKESNEHGLDNFWLNRDTEEKIKALKEILLLPERKLSNTDLSSATDGLKGVVTRLHEKMEKDASAKLSSSEVMNPQASTWSLEGTWYQSDLVTGSVSTKSRTVISTARSSGPSIAGGSQ